MKKLFLSIFIIFNSISIEAQLNDIDLNKKLKSETNYYKIEEIIKQHFGALKSKTGTQQALRNEKKYWRMLYELRDKIMPNGNLRSDIIKMRMQGEAEADRLLNQSSSDRVNYNGQWFTDGFKNVTNQNSSFGIGRVDRIVVHPIDTSIVFAGTPSGGLFKTIDGGKNWNPMTEFSANLGVSEIVIDKFNTNIMYVLSGSGDTWSPNTFVNAYGYGRPCTGIYKSIDGGASWFKTGMMADEGLDYFYGFHMVQSPTDANKLLVATNLGLYRTINGGETWTKIDANTIWDVKYKYNNDNIVFTTVHEWSSGGTVGTSKVGVSSNGGTAFSYPFIYNQTDTNNNPTGKSLYCRASISVGPANPDKAYFLFGKPDTILGTFKGLYVYNTSLGSGTFYNPPLNLFDANGGSGNGNQSEYNNCVAVAPYNENHAMFGGLVLSRTVNNFSSFVFKSTYFYNNASPSAYVHPDIHDIEYAVNGTIYVSGDGGVWKSVNGGDNWFFAGQGISSNQFYHAAMTEDDPNYLLGGLQDNGTVLKNANSLAVEHIFGCDGFDVLIDHNNKNHLIFDCNERTLRRRPGLGPIDLDLKEPKTFFANLAMHPSNSAILYLGKQALYKSLDTGAVFTNVSGLRPANFDVTTCPSNSSRIYIAGVQSTGVKTMYRSDNEGSIWNQINLSPGFPASNEYSVIKQIAVAPNNASVVAIVLGGFFDGKKVYISLDAGNNWTNISHNLPNLPANSAVITSYGDIFVGTDKGVYVLPLSKRLTGPYRPFYNQMPHVPVTELMVNENENSITAATFGRGIYRSTIAPSNCDVAMNIPSTTNHNGQQVYEVSSVLTSAANVVEGSGVNIKYSAGNSIVLTPGFDVSNSSIFLGRIAPCGSEFVFEDNLQQEGNGSRKSEIINLPNHPILAINGKAEGGVITNIKNNEIEITALEQGNFQLTILDERNMVIDKSEMMKLNASEKITFTSRIYEGHRALLYYDSNLVGFKEMK